MDPDLILRWLHVLGACVLLGTGAGIAFFMLMAHRTGDARLIAHTAGVVVLADLLFTTSAVLIQPITGGLLAWRLGWPLSEGWIALSLALYVVTGAFWLPVVWIQLRLRNLAREAADTGEALPVRYHRLFAIWFACGIPAFAAVLTIVWLMLARPDLTIRWLG
ncbi:DUF2269 family protein [Phaeobacter inhibens]|uniref:DUF2269 family protein n=1 Tax=Phaeobacter inhibens TaxID=221822 RepID=UPI00076BB8E5|nr:DUF2269 domain-containing protein [Phaeobacter inhibens]KXF89867.1 hypothetical protein AT574_14840 [Phaeobacter inhibens]WHP69183.1 DUF2269 domain-containing protein [Phaeobacter inhibens]